MDLCERFKISELNEVILYNTYWLNNIEMKNLVIKISYIDTKNITKQMKK